MLTKIQDSFLRLVRLGVAPAPDHEALFTINDALTAEEWLAAADLANEHGLLGVMLDGVDRLPRELRPGKKAIIQSVGQLVQTEHQYVEQEQAAAALAGLLDRHGIRTYVLKGTIVSECYPKPDHRKSVDMDCFLLPEEGTEDVWEKGNRVVEEAGYEVGRGFYKNSTFHLPGLTVENHRFMTPFRGNERLKRLERLLQAMMAEDAGENRFEGTSLCRPPLMVSALFLIEHAYSHFLHEGLTWRHVLDWMMFSRKYQEAIDWKAFDAYIDEYRFRRFYDSYVRMGRFLLGELSEDRLDGKERMMLSDVWAPLDLHETLHGVKGKLALAGNTWRARWKYRHFAGMSMLHALWIQVKGYLFIQHPALD